MVTVYSKPNCQPCNATKFSLDRAGVEYRVVDITEDHDARDYVLSLGFLETPVVVAGDKKWSGYRPDQIKALKQA